MLVADSKHAQALNAEHGDIIFRFCTRRTLQNRHTGHDRKALIGGDWKCLKAR